MHVSEQSQSAQVCAIIEGVPNLQDSHPFSVALQVQNGSTANLGQDFLFEDTSTDHLILDFDPSLGGVTCGLVTILDDERFEGDEVLNLTLIDRTGPFMVPIGEPRSTAVIILRDPLGI